MSDIKVEVGQYKEVNKNTLKAFFSVVIYPQGQKILDCRYFVNGENRWIAFPQKEIKFTDGRKTEYIPLISYGDKAYADELKKAILAALKNQQQSGSNVQEKAVHSKPSEVQGETSSVWF